MQKSTDLGTLLKRERERATSAALNAALAFAGFETSALDLDA
jgi:hypothetical protein